MQIAINIMKKVGHITLKYKIDTKTMFSSHQNASSQIISTFHYPIISYIYVGMKRLGSNCFVARSHSLVNTCFFSLCVSISVFVPRILSDVNLAIHINNLIICSTCLMPWHFPEF